MRKPWENNKHKLRVALLACISAMPSLAAAQIENDAPSDFSVYGRLAPSYERIDVTGQPRTWNVVDNASRLGFRGARDLGNGLSAFFQLESRIKLDTGDSFWASRGSYVGLRGPYGTARLGRVAGPVYRQLYEFVSLHNGNAGTSADAFILGSTVTGFQGIMNDAVWYTSPPLGQVRLDAAYALLGETPLPGMSQPHHLGFVAAYDAPRLHVAVARADTRSTRDLGGGTPSEDIAYAIGGLYGLPQFAVGGLFERSTSRLPVDEARRTYVRAVAMIPVGRHEFHVNVGRVDHRLDAKLSDDGAVQWTTAYAYNFDRQTKVYTFYTVVNNQHNGNYGFSTRLPGIDNRSIAVGVRYDFEVVFAGP